jgi:hypothetical protein
LVGQENNFFHIRIESGQQGLSTPQHVHGGFKERMSGYAHPHSRIVLDVVQCCRISNCYRLSLFSSPISLLAINFSTCRCVLTRLTSLAVTDIGPPEKMPAPSNWYLMHLRDNSRRLSRFGRSYMSCDPIHANLLVRVSARTTVR